MEVENLPLLSLDVILHYISLEDLFTLSQIPSWRQIIKDYYTYHLDDLRYKIYVEAINKIYKMINSTEEFNDYDLRLNEVKNYYQSLYDDINDYQQKIMTGERIDEDIMEEYGEYFYADLTILDKLVKKVRIRINPNFIL